MAGGKASVIKIKIVERQQRALELRKAGASYRQIADKISKDPKFNQPKYNDALAHRDVVDLLKKVAESNRAGAVELRELEAQRLDMAAVAIAQQVRNGHLGAIDRWLKIIEARVRLYGLSLDDLNRAWGTLEAYGFDRIEDENGGFRLVDRYTKATIEADVISDDSEIEANLTSDNFE